MSLYRSLSMLPVGFCLMSDKVEAKSGSIGSPRGLSLLDLCTIPSLKRLTALASATRSPGHFTAEGESILSASPSRFSSGSESSHGPPHGLAGVAPSSASSSQPGSEAVVPNVFESRSIRQSKLFSSDEFRWL